MNPDNERPMWKIVIGFLVVLALITIAFTILKKPPRTTASKNPCINNLRAIDGAKKQWAENTMKLPTDTPTWADLVGPGKLIKHQLVCPNKGVYTLGNVSSLPTCSIPHHTLP